MRNMGYYLRESFRLFSGKSVLSLISTTMLLLLSIFLSCAYFVSMHYSEMLAAEAEIAVFYSAPEKIESIEQQIEDTDGVLGITRISREQAKIEMKEFLGDDAKILERMKDNPFLPYLRVRVQSNISEASLEQIKSIPLVTHVRDNRDILSKIDKTTSIVGMVGIVLVLVSVLTSAFIYYYVSSENIALRRDQIENMKHMGAPDSFIMRPFVWHSVLLNMISSVIACGGAYFLAYYVKMVEISNVVLVCAVFFALTIVVGIVSTLISGRKFA